MRKILVLLFLCPLVLKAQEEEFDMSDFEEASDAKVYVTNKILGLSPTKLINISYDYIGENTWQSEPEMLPDNAFNPEAPVFTRNTGFRLETNYPVISNNKLIVNAYLNYWESNYRADVALSRIGSWFNQNGLKSTALGAFIFKPLNDRNFLLFQLEGALNGNYDLSGSVSADFGKIKFSAAALYGWKLNDYTNVAVGLTRTYRGGRLLHIPVLMYNKTFNETWGLEMLLPARAAVRRNFSTKSFLMLGYELEGQSYHLQDDGAFAPPFGQRIQNDDWELRKSEIRARISWDKSITDFIWFNVQAGVAVNYRMAIDLNEGASDAWIVNTPGTPLYFRFGIQLVSP